MTFSYELGRPSLHFVKNHPAKFPRDPISVSRGKRGQGRAAPIDFSEAGDAPYISGLRQALGQAGYIEGQNIEILFRFAALQFDRLPALVSDLVARRVAVIIASGGAAAVSAKVATRTIPIVFESANDPIQMGLVTSLSRPGGNLTGATVLNGAYFAKSIEMMHELLPQASSFVGLREYPMPEAKKPDF